MEWIGATGIITTLIIIGVQLATFLCLLRRIDRMHTGITDSKNVLSREVLIGQNQRPTNKPQPKDD